jgi:hypothetical protein
MTLTDMKSTPTRAPVFITANGKLRIPPPKIVFNNEKMATVSLATRDSELNPGDRESGTLLRDLMRRGTSSPVSRDSYPLLLLPENGAVDINLNKCP